MTTVKDLIKHLQQFNPELPVVLTHTDHTDWTYNWDLSLDGVNGEKDIYLDEDSDSEDPDYPECVIISCTPWD